jgi:hypothetical protein
VQALVRDRLLLPEDANRYKAKVRSSEIAKLFTQANVDQAAR